MSFENFIQQLMTQKAIQHGASELPPPNSMALLQSLFHAASGGGSPQPTPLPPLNNQPFMSDFSSSLGGGAYVPMPTGAPQIDPRLAAVVTGAGLGGTNLIGPSMPPPQRVPQGPDMSAFLAGAMQPGIQGVAGDPLAAAMRSNDAALANIAANPGPEDNDPVGGALLTAATQSPATTAKDVGAAALDAAGYGQHQVALQLANGAYGVAKGDFSAKVADQALQSGPLGILMKELPSAGQMLVWAEGNDENSKQQIIDAMEKGYDRKNEDGSIKGHVDAGPEAVLALYEDSLNFAGDIAFQTTTDPAMLIPGVEGLGELASGVRVADDASLAAKAGAATIRGAGRVAEGATAVTKVPEKVLGAGLSAAGGVVKATPILGDAVKWATDLAPETVQRLKTEGQRRALGMLGRSEETDRALADALTPSSSTGLDTGSVDDILSAGRTEGAAVDDGLGAPSTGTELPQSRPSKGRIAGDVVGTTESSEIVRTPQGNFSVQDAASGMPIAEDLPDYASAERVAQQRESSLAQTQAEAEGATPPRPINLDELAAQEELQGVMTPTPPPLSTPDVAVTPPPATPTAPFTPPDPSLHPTLADAGVTDRNGNPRRWFAPSPEGQGIVDEAARGDPDAAKRFYDAYEPGAAKTKKEMIGIDNAKKRSTTLSPDAAVNRLEDAPRKAELAARDYIENAVPAWKQAFPDAPIPPFRPSYGDGIPDSLSSIERATAVNGKEVVTNRSALREMWERAPGDRPDPKNLFEQAVFAGDDQLANDLRYTLRQSPNPQVRELADSAKDLRAQVYGPESVTKESFVRDRPSQMAPRDSAPTDLPENPPSVDVQSGEAVGSPDDPAMATGDAPPPPSEFSDRVSPSVVVEQSPPPTSIGGQEIRSPQTQSFDASNDRLMNAVRMGDLPGNYEDLQRGITGLKREGYQYKEDIAAGRKSLGDKDEIRKGRKHVGQYGAFDDAPETALLFENVKTGGKWVTNKDTGEKILEGADQSKRLGDLYFEKLDELNDVDKAIDATMSLVARDIPIPQRTGIRKALGALSNGIKHSMMFSWSRAPQRWVGDDVGNGWQAVQSGHPEVIADVLRDMWRSFSHDDTFIRGAMRDLDGAAVEGLAKSEMGKAYEELGYAVPASVETGEHIAREGVDRSAGTPMERLLRKKFSERGARIGAAISTATGLTGGEVMQKTVTAMDTAWRGALHFSEVMRGLEPVKQDFFNLADRTAAKGGDAAALREGLGGLFSPKKIREEAVAAGYKAGDAEMMARSWTNSTNRLMRNADAEVDRVYFSFQSTNLDEKLAKVFFFHHWASRASAFYLRTAIKNPAVMATYAHMKDAMERNADPGHEGFIKAFNHAGVLGYINPLYMVSTALISFEPEFQRPDDRMIDQVLNKVPAMLNPMLQGVLSASGVSSQGSVDPLALFGPRRMWEGLINSAKAEGLFGDKTPFVSPDQEMWENLVGATSSWLEQHGAPWAKKVTEKLPQRNDIAIRNSLIVSKVYEAHGIAPNTDPESLASNPATKPIFDELVLHIGNADNPNVHDDPVVNAAMKEWALGGSLPKAIFGAIVPGGVRLTTEKLDHLNQVRANPPAYEAVPGAAQTSAQDQMALIQSSGPQDLALDTAKMQYDAAGNPRQQQASRIYNRIAYSPEELGETGITAGGVHYSGEQLRTMTEDQRKGIAEIKLGDYGLTGEREALMDARQPITDANPELAAYQDWAGSARDIGMEKMMRVSPRYRAYIEGLPKDTRSDPSRLSGAAFSLAAYEASQGERSSIYADKPREDALDISQVDPVDLLTGGGSGGQSSQQSTDPIAQLSKDQSRYQTDVVLFNSMLQQYTQNPQANWDTMIPAYKQVIAQQFSRMGISAPSEPQSITTYNRWVAARQAQGMASDLAAYAQWYQDVEAPLKQRGLSLQQILDLQQVNPNAIQQILGGTPSTATSP